MQINNAEDTDRDQRSTPLSLRAHRAGLEVEVASGGHDRAHEPTPRNTSPGQPAGLFARYPLSRQGLVIGCDVTALTVALPLAIMLRESGWLAGDRLLYLLSCAPLLAATSLAASLLLGHYRAVWRYMGIGEIIQLANFVLVAVLLFYTSQFFVDRLDQLPRSAPLIHFLVALFLLLGGRIIYGEWCRWTEAGADRPHRQPLLLVGAGDGAALVIQLLGQASRSGYEPVGILCDTVARHRRVNGVPVLGSLADIDKVLATLRVQGMTPARVVVTRPHHEIGREGVYQLMQRAYVHRIPVEQLPDLMRFRGDMGSSTEMSDRSREMEALGSRSATRGSPREGSLYPRLKRGFDILVAGLVLVATAPLLLAAAIAVATAIQRPVLFVQIRPGLQRRPFKLLKFRTMKDPVSADGRTLTDAERTPLAGRLLRRSRLDELPQFWNVLKGDMAIIGPRPLVAGDLDAMPDNGVARARTRPGITGWAQINGGHQLRPDEKLALDLWYSENATPTLDAQIIWRTITMMLLGEKRDERAITSALEVKPVMVGAAE